MRELVSLSLLLVLAGCGEPAREASRGPAGPAGPRVFVEALAALFGPIQREPGFEALRPKLARAALTPSRIFDDASAWTWQDGEWRGIELVGYRTGPAYRIGTRSAAPAPSGAADYRERVRLRRTGPGRFEWEVSEELAAGELRPDDLAAALTAVFREAQRQDAPALRAAFAASLPKTTARLSLLLRVETLKLDRDATGATRIELGVRLTPSGLRSVAPRYAEYLRRYMSPMQLEVAALDSSETAWWRLGAAANLWTLRLRVRDGSLVPLVGAPDRGIPAELRIVGDYDTKMGMFGVGLRRLVARVDLTRSSAEKGLVARFSDEPEWHLPFLVAPLLRGSLRHPFEGPGSEIALSVRRAPGRPTLLTGRYRYRVRESWILRWMGGLTSNAVFDFRGGAEDESVRYHGGCLLALRDDLAALVPRETEGGLHPRLRVGRVTRGAADAQERVERGGATGDGRRDQWARRLRERRGRKRGDA
jgi:hypothetical protein